MSLQTVAVACVLIVGGGCAGPTRPPNPPPPVRAEPPGQIPFAGRERAGRSSVDDDAAERGRAFSRLVRAVGELHRAVVPSAAYPAWVEPDQRVEWLTAAARLDERIRETAAVTEEERRALAAAGDDLLAVTECLAKWSFEGTEADLESLRSEAEDLRADLIWLGPTPSRDAYRAALDRCNAIGGRLRTRPTSRQIADLLREVSEVHRQIRLALRRLEQRVQD